MKKLIALLAASMLLTISFASCGDSDDDSESSSKKAKSSTSSSQGDEENTEDDTEDDTEASTKKSKKNKEKATEDDTEEDTEEDTTKKSKKEKTTKEKSTGTVDPEDLPGEIGGDIVGKWSIDEDTLAELIGENDLHGMEISDCIMEFGDDGVCTISCNVDMSSVMCIKDEEPNALYVDKERTAMKGKTLSLGGVCMPIYDFDGKSFETGFNKTFYTFKRDEKSDDIYGKYDIPDGFGSKEEMGYMKFEKSGVAYMNYFDTKDYIYDEKEGTITSNDSDKEPSNVRFTDDDTMIIADSTGTLGTLKRVK